MDADVHLLAKFLRRSCAFRAVEVGKENPNVQIAFFVRISRQKAAKVEKIRIEFLKQQRTLRQKQKKGS